MGKGREYRSSTIQPFLHRNCCNQLPCTTAHSTASGSRYIHPYRCCVRPLQAIKHRKKAFGTKHLKWGKTKTKGKELQKLPYLYHKWARTELPIGSREMGWGWMLGYVCRCTLRVCTRFLFVHTPSFFIHDYSAIAFLSLLSRFSVPSL